MKKTSWIAASALLVAVLSLGAVAERAGTRARVIDDPPPEPVTCPLCGGDPALHVARVFAFTDVATRATALALRW
jgi:hypothetical protein